MRILLLADIHGNWPALQAITEHFDVCICLGDLVDYGMEPIPCIDWVRKNCKHVVRGNHDHGVAQNVVVNGQTGFKWLTSVTRPFTRQMLSEGDRRFLMEMPVMHWTTIDDLRFMLVHATPRDPMDEYAPATAEFWARMVENVEADVICVGHTHMPFALEAGGKIVVNPGSVGLSRDGNPRASYAILEGRKVELKRIDYPIETTVNVIRQSALPEPAKDLLIEVYRTGEAKNPKVDSRVQRTSPSNQGLGRVPQAIPVANVAKPRPTVQGVVRPQGTAPGTDATPAVETSGLQGDAAPAPLARPVQRSDTRPMPVLGRQPAPPASSPEAAPPAKRLSPDDIESSR